MAKLRLLLGDQLSHQITSLEGLDKKADTILIAEVMDEATYVKHHKKKIAFLFSAMRHFKGELEENGATVRYITLDDPANSGSLKGEVARAIEDLAPDELIITHPGEYRLRADMKTWPDELGIKMDLRPDNRFLITASQFKSWAGERKELRMEDFYRAMRQHFNILMDGEKPEGGKWNYDSENRKPADEKLEIPSTYKSQKDSITREVINLVNKTFPDHFGDVEPFHFAVTGQAAMAALNLFIKQRLPRFGDYQDAMIKGEPFMFHALISLYLNSGLLDPMTCIKKAEQAYQDEKAPLNAVEGFIRQILGWREYVRGVYWLKMPDYKQQNFFKAERKLPSFYWTAETRMNCLRQCVLETRANAYAHHIQRLMVLGNFALLAGIKPDEVNEWFLIVYADAYEWVELPNVSGMILYADGGVLGTKPYAAGGNYINKMSNYCKSCSYKVSKKNGPEACPFNYLYWDFLDRNEPCLKDNPRLRLPYQTLKKMKKEKRTANRADSQRFLNDL